MPSEQLPQVLHTYQNHHLDSTRWKPYAPRDDDIVISTFLKSGTTWTQGIVRELIVHSLESHDADAPKQAPLPDKKSSLWPDACFAGEIERLYQDLEAQTHRISQNPFAVGWIAFLSPGQISGDWARCSRCIYVPMESLLKLYGDFYKMINEDLDLIGAPCPRCPDDIHDFWQGWISQGWFDWEQEGYPYWGNMHHAQTRWNYRHLANMQFFHYADMLADPKDEIKRIADFLDIEVSDETLTAIVQHTSLSAMQQRNAKAGPYLLLQRDEWSLARGAVRR